MLRVSRADHPRNILITIEGQLAGDGVRSAESACAEALSADRPVTVLLRGVMEVDARGRAFLRDLLKTRSRVRARGIYSQYLLHSLRDRLKPRRS